MRIVPVMVALLLAGCTGISDDENVPDANPSIVDEGPTSIIETRIVPYPDAATVKLFVQDGPLENGQFGMSNPQGTRLTPRQRSELASAFSKLEVRGTIPDDFGVVADCFIPHHFFRYFDRDGNAIGEIAVCFCCGGEQASPALVREDERTLFRSDLGKIQRLVETMSLPVDVNCGGPDNPTP